LPTARKVLYESLPEEAEAEPPNLVEPQALQPGALYEMVVSDASGLKRYRMGDLFACHRLVGGLPDLRFMRRSGLSYSFTGEKLTEQQVIAAIDRLRSQSPGWDPRTSSLPVSHAPIGRRSPRLSAGCRDAVRRSIWDIGTASSDAPIRRSVG
jgi:hypothetical protein